MTLEGKPALSKKSIRIQAIIMHIYQITDLHYRSTGTRLYGYVDVHSMLERTVNHIKSQDPSPDCVIVTGDLTNDGTLNDYEAVAEILGRFDCPVYITPGNHDERHHLRRVFEGLPDDGHFFQVIQDFPVKLVILDSLVEGKHHGFLGPTQLQQLDQTLASDPEKPTVLAFHHPPFKTGVSFMDEIDLHDSIALSAVLTRYNNVEAVLCGHLHRMIFKRFAGTIAMTGPGAAHAVTLDLSGEQSRPLWVLEPPGFLVHKWTPDAGLATHRAYLPDFGPAAPFHDQHQHLVPLDP